LPTTRGTIIRSTGLTTTRRGFNTARTPLRTFDGTAPPSVSARGYLRNSMPRIYQDGDFGLRFLAALELVLDPIVCTLDVLPRYFHPSVAPRDVLELLAGWLGIATDESWPDDRLREVLSRAGEISRRRGTRRGLELALGIAFPDLPFRVEDSGRVTWTTDSQTTLELGSASFVVYCDTPLTEDQQGAVARLIDQLKPVSASYRLRVKAPRKKEEAEQP
jgi:phage tail-like protein